MAIWPFGNRKKLEASYLYFVAYRSGDRNYNTIVNARVLLDAVEDVRYLESRFARALKEEKNLDVEPEVVITAFNRI